MDAYQKRWLKSYIGWSCLIGKVAQIDFCSSTRPRIFFLCDAFFPLQLLLTSVPSRHFYNVLFLKWILVHVYSNTISKPKAEWWILSHLLGQIKIQGVVLHGTRGMQHGSMVKGHALHVESFRFGPWHLQLGVSGCTESFLCLRSCRAAANKVSPDWMRSVPWLNKVRWCLAAC